MQTNAYHIPALLSECMDGLAIRPDGTYVDVTFGGGGHSLAIMQRLGPDGHLYGFDQDIDALANSIDDPRFTFVHSNFAYLTNFLHYYHVSAVDGLLADLGVSFHHFDDKDRGFSFRQSGRLDMRMNQSRELDARTVIAEYTQEQLADIFFLYGELKSARRLAETIVKARSKAAIDTTEQLLDVVRPLIRPAQEKKELAQVFQALRIEVNDEISVLKALLRQSVKALAPGGRIAIITYHSLEDRLVKNFFRTGNVQGHEQKDFFGRTSAPLKLVNNKVITPSDGEVQANPRSRSAKLRVARKPDSDDNNNTPKH